MRLTHKFCIYSDNQWPFCSKMYFPRTNVTLSIFEILMTQLEVIFTLPHPAASHEANR